MSEETRRPNSLALLHNEKMRLGEQIEKLVRPFCERYQLSLEQIEIRCNPYGIHIKVVL